MKYYSPQLQKPPEYVPPLEPEFIPAVLFNREYEEEARSTGNAVPLVIGLGRPDGTFSRYETQIQSDDKANQDKNLFYIERICKFLLWQRGGAALYIGGPSQIGDWLKQIYSPEGARAFDYEFMGEDVYQQKFEVISCTPDEVPPDRESERSIGRHLNGARIGFDLGASDLKVSAVVDGQAIFSKEIEWNPGIQTDPNYHKQMIKAVVGKQLAGDEGQNCW